MHNAKMFNSGYLQMLRFTIHSFLQLVSIEHFAYMVVMINSGNMAENIAGKILPYGAYFLGRKTKKKQVNKYKKGSQLLLVK